MLKGKRISIITLGCKLNQAESEYMGEKLNDLGYEIIYDSKNDHADIFIINSCTVTSEAERKTRQIVRHIKRNFKNSKIIVAGCYSQASPHDLIKLGVDLVLGNKEKKYIENYLTETGIFVTTDYGFLENDKVVIPHKPYSNRIRYFLPIEEGCNRYCSYCQIIKVRGHSIRSVSPEQVIDYIDFAINRGIKEIVLTGVNLALYGFREKYDLKSLLKIINNRFHSKKVRIRVSSLYPDYIDDELIDIYLSSEILEKHIHLSLQHVSDNVLKRMGRWYTKKDIVSILNGIRKKYEYFAIGMDIIVGFPGEREEDFKELIDFVDDFDILKIHGFRYSSRPLAKIKEDSIRSEIKKERIKVLLEHAKLSRYRFIRKIKNEVKPNVLVENVSNDESFGYDEFYIYHRINENLKIGDFVKVVIDDIQEKEVKSFVLH